MGKFIIIASHGVLKTGTGFERLKEKILESEPDVLMRHINLGNADAGERIEDISRTLREKGAETIRAVPFVLSGGSIKDEIESRLRKALSDIPGVQYEDGFLSDKNRSRISDTIAASIPEKEEIQVLLTGHGSFAYGNSDYTKLAADLKSRWNHTDVHLAMINGSPSFDDVLGQIKEKHKKVRVIPLFLSKGRHFSHDIAGGKDSICERLVKEGLEVQIEDKCLLEYDAVSEEIKKIIIGEA